MMTSTILARALIHGDDLGELTVNMTPAERDAIEYAYNRAQDQDWHLAVVDDDGLALGASGVINVSHSGALVPVPMEDARDGD